MMKFKEGVYEDLPFSIYNEIPAYRASDLKEAHRCVFTWMNKKPMNESPILLEGRVQHTVFLEHHKFDEEFVIEPKIDKRTKAGKADYADFLNTVGDRTPISQTLYDNCMERRDVVKDYIPKDDHRVELTICFMWNGHPFKSRIDWHDGVKPWDLKTCRDASPRGFRSAVNSYGYFMQGSLYVDACKSAGVPSDGFAFLAQEKAHPYPYGIYELSDEALEYGRSKNEQALSMILHARSNDDIMPYNLSGKQTIQLEDLW